MFDLHTIPFSRRDSFLKLAFPPPRQIPAPGLYLMTVRKQGSREDLLRVTLNGRADLEVTGSPGSVQIRQGETLAEVVMPDPHTVLFRVSGGSLELELMQSVKANVAFPTAEGRWEVVFHQAREKCQVVPRSGRLSVRAPWMVDACEEIVIEAGGDGAPAEFALVFYETVYVPRSLSGWDEAATAVSAEFEAFLATCPPAPPEWEEARRLAAYINWSAIVAPRGRLTRPTMLMSKNHMTNVWSWDHAFNAWALAAGDPKLGWDQMLGVMDLQDASGVFPDGTNDIASGWSFCKPPIHGWVLNRMRRRTDWIGKNQLREIALRLERQVEFWFQWRDYDGSGLPQYTHGNDSGWDNSTVWHDGAPIKGPDLSAFLVLQMEELARIARELDRPAEAAAWQARADAHLEKLLGTLWNGRQFIAPRPDGRWVEHGDSLILFLPLILGKRLPEEIRAALIAGLKEEGRFLTEWGLATESLRSRHYVPDGYWRGPIWGPPTLILVDALMECGEPDFARDLARRYGTLCATHGFAENFDAVTGQGLRDRAYTWTSSIWMILASEYVEARPQDLPSQAGEATVEA